VINPDSELAQRFWEQGRLPDCPLLDFHAHMYDAAGLFLPRKTPEQMLRTMDACNTILTCFCGHETMMLPSPDRAQDIDAVRRYPDRFRAYDAVISRYLSPEHDLKRVEDNPDVFVGFKFHGDSYQVPLSDPRHQPYWEYADHHRLLVLSHTWGRSPNDGPDEVEKILRKYPNLVFIAGHGFHDEWQRAPALARAYPHLYLELTAVLDNRGQLDMFVREAGSRKILFGTDLPWFSTHHGIGAVLSAEMTDEDRRNIFHRNGEKLLRRFPWFDAIWKARGPSQAA
jgi:predicted TIM-barrel fold metal-dependent hydrolase